MGFNEKKRQRERERESGWCIETCVVFFDDLA